MWKFVSRRLSVPCERGFNQLENRSPSIVNQGTGPEETNKRSGPPCRWLTSKRFNRDSSPDNHRKFRSRRFCEKLNSTSAGTGSEEINRTRPGPPCRWFSSRKCWDSFKTDNNDTNQKKFNFDYLNRTWLGAISWSGVLVVGWYTSQLAHLKLKYCSKDYQEQCKSFNNIVKTLHPYILNLRRYSPQPTSSSNIDHVFHKYGSKVHFVSNEKNGGTETENKTQSDYGSESCSSNDEFQDTLNYIENKLGWAAIQNGQLKDGLQLLRSAANRNHAPALYNLGLCYEMGIGSDVNEHKAMEFYRSAARLQHPDALYNLSIYYAQGRGGLTKDKDTATRLLRLAAVQGHQTAKDALVFLEEDITEIEKGAELNSWSYQYSPFAQNGVGPPTLASLFVENVNYIPSH